MARLADRDADETRRGILEIAFAQFGLRGLDGISNAQLAKRCGITTGTLYWHFGDKQGIYLACLDRLQADLNTALIAPLEGGGGFLARLEAFFSGLSIICGDSDRAAVYAGYVYQIGVSELEPVEAFRRRMDAWLQDGIAAFLADGREAGAFEFEASPHAYARLMLTIVEGSLLAARRGHVGEIIDVLTREAVLKTIGATRALK